MEEEEAEEEEEEGVHHAGLASSSNGRHEECVFYVIQSPHMLPILLFQLALRSDRLQPCLQ